MELLFIIILFVVGGLASISVVSTAVERTGLKVAEDKVFDRRL